MRSRLLVRSVVALGLLAGAWAVARHDAAAQGTAESPVAGSFLFVQPAGGGRLEPIAGMAGQYRLTLTDVPPTVVYFSSRPTREVGQLAPQTLVANWAAGRDSLATDPPNAALDFLNGPSGQVVIVFELYEPTYDPATQTMTYRAVILPSSDRVGLADLLSRAAPLAAVSGEFGPAVLFIDDVCLSCW